MDEAARDDERTVVRMSVEAPWLGNAAECVLSGGLVLLRDTESEAALSLDPHTFQGRTGRLLRFRVPVDHLIDFAEGDGFPSRGWDGSVAFSCHDEPAAQLLSRRIEHLGDNRVPQLAKPWWQVGSRFTP